MEQDLIRIGIVILLTWGGLALNGAVNSVPKLKQILDIVIILVGCLFLITPVVDLINIALSSVHGR